MGKRKAAKRGKQAPHQQQHQHQRGGGDNDAGSDHDEEDISVPGDGETKIKCKHLNHFANNFASQAKNSNFKVCEGCLSSSGQKGKGGGGKGGNKGKSKSQWAKLSEANSAKPDELWVCLSCAAVVCKAAGREHVFDHYAQKNKHFLYLHVKTQQLWCASCEDTIPIDPSHTTHEALAECISVVKNLVSDNNASAAGSGFSSNSKWKASDAAIQAEKEKEKKKQSGKSQEDDYKELEKSGLQLDGVKGLKNLGNTCFFNSVMQNIAQTVPLRERFVVRADGTAVPVPPEGPLTKALREFMVAIWIGPGKSYSPSGILSQVGKRNSRFMGRQQQDSHELLRYLLDGLSTEEKKVIEILKARAELKRKAIEEAEQKVKELNGEEKNEAKNEAGESKEASQASAEASAQPSPATAVSAVEDTTTTATIARSAVNTAEATPQVESPATAKSDDSPVATPSPASPETQTAQPEPTSTAVDATSAVETPKESSLPATEVPAAAEPIAQPTSEATSAATTSADSQPNFEEPASPASSDENHPADVVANSEAQPTGDAPATTASATDATTPQESPAASAAATAPAPPRYPTPEEESVDSIFGGEFQSRVTCHVCGQHSTVHEPFLDLSLPIPTRMLSDKIRKQLEEIEEENKRLMAKQQAKFQAALEKKKAQAEGKGKADEAGAESKNSAPGLVQPPDGLGKKALRRWRVQQAQAIAQAEADAKARAKAAAETLAPAATDSTSTQTGDASSTASQSTSTETPATPAIETPTEGEASATTAQATSAEAPITAAEVTAETVVPAAQVSAAETLAPSGEPQAETTAQEAQPDQSQPSTPEVAQDESSTPTSSDTAATPSETPVDTIAAPSEPTSDETAVSAASVGEVVVIEVTDAAKEEPKDSEELQQPAEAPSDPESVERVPDTANLADAASRSLYDIRPASDPPASASVGACLSAFTEPELLSGENAFACYHCTKKAWIDAGKDLTPLIQAYGTDEDKKTLPEELRVLSANAKTKATKFIELLKRPATKQLLINRAPRVLTLHLKRFMQMPTGGFRKIGTAISFPTILDLAPFSVPTEEGGVKYKYQLYGVVNHSGNMGGGHYVAFSRKRPLQPPSLDDDLNGSWYYASDTHLSKTSLSDVLTQEAYILFYDRVPVPKE